MIRCHARPEGPSTSWMSWTLAALLAVGALACGDTSPQREELASPAEREAVPVDEEDLEETREQRQQELPPATRAPE